MTELWTNLVRWLESSELTTLRTLWAELKRDWDLLWRGDA